MVIGLSLMYKATHYSEAPVIQRISQASAQLPPAQRRLAEYVLENAFQVASGTIESLAIATQVSTATANRFACALGFSGYAEFRQSLLQVFKPSLVPLEKLRNELTREAKAVDVVHESLAGSIAGIQATENGLSEAGLERAADMLLGARNVFCLGLGASTHLADIAALSFAPYCANINTVSRHGGAESALHHLQRIGQEDLLIAISFPRYSADMLRMMRFAQARGASILAVTDRPSSPLMGVANHTLFAQAEHQVLPISLVAAVALIEGVAAALAHKNPAALKEAVELTEQLLPYFYFDPH